MQADEHWLQLESKQLQIYDFPCQSLHSSQIYNSNPVSWLRQG